jgi:hypothetical protein
MKKEIKTDNMLTQVVIDAQAFIHELQGEIKNQYRTPFMRREISPSEKRKLNGQ